MLYTLFDTFLFYVLLKEIILIKVKQISNIVTS